MSGGESLTVRVMVLESEPPVFVPVIVNGLAVRVIVGVPEITQLEAIESPAGRAGLVAHEATAPPEFVGVMAVAATPF